jgi:hypothetical protein
MKYDFSCFIHDFSVFISNYTYENFSDFALVKAKTKKIMI